MKGHLGTALKSSSGPPLGERCPEASPRADLRKRDPFLGSTLGLGGVQLAVMLCVAGCVPFQSRGPGLHQLPDCPEPPESNENRGTREMCPVRGVWCVLGECGI